MLDLKNTTLVIVATRAHAMSRVAIEDCLAKADFAEVIIYTDDRDKIVVPGARYFYAPDFPNKKLAGEFYYSGAAANVTTPFGLYIEWDGGIFDAKNWRPEFFEYDYIGAPWTLTTDDHRVGNGGFTLMSNRLGAFLCNERKRFPVCTDFDVCRKQRSALEAAGGFKWAPYDVAAKFAWELTPRPTDNFGYHATFTWPFMLPKEELIRRTEMMIEDDYLFTKISPLIKAANWLLKEISPAALEKYQGQYPTEMQRHGHVFRPGQQARTANTLAQRRANMLALMQRQGLKA
jgi:hypothetical protein